MTASCRFVGGVICGLYCMLLLLACRESEPEQVLPSMPVRATLQLNDAQYVHLQNIGEFLEVTERRGAFTYIGVGGLLVVHLVAPMDASVPFAAFDLYCPYCYPRTITHPRVRGQAGGLVAECSTCSSKYDLTAGFGGCIEGPGRQLQRYRTNYSHSLRTLTIGN